MASHFAKQQDEQDKTLARATAQATAAGAATDGAVGTQAPGEDPAGEPALDETVLSQPLDKTELFPLPSPSYDEESGMGIGEQDRYAQDYSRLDQAYQGKRRAREIPIPHLDDEDGAGYRVPGEGRSRSRWRPILAFFLVAAMVGGIFAAGSYGLELWGGKSVPNVTGISEGRARLMLEDAGFAMETKTRIADDGIGFVMEQSPENGVRAEEGSTVTVVIAVSRTMPEVVGLTQEEAEALLSKAGAEDVRVVAKSSAEEEGRVVAVSPGVGEPFSSYQTVTLTVSQKPQVPDVLGMEKVEARALVEQAGFVVEEAYVRSDATPNTVVQVDPEVGTKLDPGAKVKLSFSEPMPSNVFHLQEYFGKSPQNLSRYLADQGFTLGWGSASGDRGESTYLSDDKGYLLFCERPFDNSYPAHGDTGTEPLAQGLGFTGIRWEVPSGMLPKGAAELTDAASRELMSKCGLSNITDVCTHKDVTVPSGVKKTDAKFRCTYGETGNCSWSVLLVSEGNDVRAVVTCVPAHYYDSYDLKPFGDKPCDLIACGDVYGGV